MPPMPPLPPMLAAIDQAAMLEQVQQLMELSPRLAFEKASLVRDALLRERLRRDAFVEMARTRPKDAATVLAQVIDARWLPAVHFAQALDVAWYTVREQPELSRRLLVATAARHPVAALREARQYVDLPYGGEIREAARRASANGDAELELLRIRQNPGAAIGLGASEILRLASQARTENERETALALLGGLNWQGVTSGNAGALRGALALLAETGSLEKAPAGVVGLALADLENTEDPLAEAVKAAVILAAAPPEVADALPATPLGRLLGARRTGESTMAVATLFPNGLCAQRYVFHNDDDGVESFESFLRAYAGDVNWSVERGEGTVRVSGRGDGGRRIEIFANVPIDLQLPANFGAAAAMEARQGAVTRALKDRGLKSTVIVHRGHDHHFAATRKYLRSEARLVFLGSCRGMQNVEEVVTRCRRAQMIATRGVGTTTVNDTFLRALNRKLLAGGEVLDWEQFWAGLGSTMGGNEQFRLYVPPHRNAAAQFLAAWYHEALDAP